MIVAISLIVASFSFLLYRHPPSSWHLNGLWTIFLRLLGSDQRKAIVPVDVSVPVNVSVSVELSGPTDTSASTALRDAVGPAVESQTEGARAVGSRSPQQKAERVRMSPTKIVEQKGTPLAMFPAANSSQRASSKSSLSNSASLRVSRGAGTTSSLLMPPPPVPRRRLQPSHNLLQSSQDQERASSKRAPAKIILAPGHSPLDWAHKLRSGADLAGAVRPAGVRPSELRRCNGRKGQPAWSAWRGRVYNLGPFLPYHPGGAPELLRAAGRDGTKLFLEVHPWVSWENMLGPALIGTLLPEEAEDVVDSALEELE